MFRLVTHAIRLTIILLLVCGLFGSATNTTAHRYYSDPPLPNNETALIFTIATYSAAQGAGGCQMESIRGESEKETKRLGYGPSEMIEVLPGQYIVTFKLLYLKANHEKYDSINELTLNVQAGNIYVIYPEIEGKGSKIPFHTALGSDWHPMVLNINDYSAEKCSDSRYKLRCTEKEIIQKKAAKYFLSERPTISYHPSNVILVNVDGVKKQLEVGDVWK